MRPAPILYSGTPLRHTYPGIPTSWNAELRAKAADDLRVVGEVYPKLTEIITEVDDHADIEDFWEDLARTAAAIRAARELGTDFIDCSSQSAKNTWTAGQMPFRLGPVFVAEEASHNPDTLIDHPIVNKHGGRFMRLAGYTDEPGELAADDDVVQIAHSRARAGVERVVIKMADSKKGIFTLDLHPTITEQEISEQLLGDDDFGWVFIRLAGREKTMLIQDWIPMACEYRLFVVDGQIITAAGCIEEFMPYSRLTVDQDTDLRLRRNRGNSVIGGQASDLVEDPETVDALLAFGAGVAEEFDGTIVIDVARNAETDELIVVELNTLPNAGLYASNIDTLYLALATADDRGYGHYAWAH